MLGGWQACEAHRSTCSIQLFVYQQQINAGLSMGPPCLVSGLLGALKLIYNKTHTHTRSVCLSLTDSSSVWYDITYFRSSINFKYTTIANSNARVVYPNMIRLLVSNINIAFILDLNICDWFPFLIAAGVHCWVHFSEYRGFSQTFK